MKKRKLNSRNPKYQDKNQVSKDVVKKKILYCTTHHGCKIYGVWYEQRRIKKIVVFIRQNQCTRKFTSDGPDGYNSFKTNQGDNALKYAKDRMKQNKYKEYKLIIK